MLFILVHYIFRSLYASTILSRDVLKHTYQKLTMHRRELMLASDLVKVYFKMMLLVEMQQFAIVVF